MNHPFDYKLQRNYTGQLTTAFRAAFANVSVNCHHCRLDVCLQMTIKTNYNRAQTHCKNRKRWVFRARLFAIHSWQKHKHIHARKYTKTTTATTTTMMTTTSSASTNLIVRVVERRASTRHSQNITSTLCTLSRTAMAFILYRLAWRVVWDFQCLVVQYTLIHSFALSFYF